VEPRNITNVIKTVWKVQSKYIEYFPEVLGHYDKLIGQEILKMRYWSENILRLMTYQYCNLAWVSLLEFVLFNKICLLLRFLLFCCSCMYFLLKPQKVLRFDHDAILSSNVLKIEATTTAEWMGHRQYRYRPWAGLWNLERKLSPNLFQLYLAIYLYL